MEVKEVWDDKELARNCEEVRVARGRTIKSWCADCPIHEACEARKALDK